MITTNFFSTSPTKEDIITTRPLASGLTFDKNKNPKTNNTERREYFYILCTEHRTPLQGFYTPTG